MMLPCNQHVILKSGQYFPQVKIFTLIAWQLNRNTEFKENANTHSKNDPGVEEI